MGRGALLMIAAAACGSPESDIAEPCTKCVPGDLTAGRFIGGMTYPTVGTNGAGVIVIAGSRRIEWRTDDFELDHTVPIERVVTEIAVTSDGGVVVEAEGLLIALAPDGSERWRTMVAAGDLAVSGDLVFLATDIATVARDLATGATRWVVPAATRAVATLPGGGVAIGGTFRGTLALGGTAPQLDAATSAGFVAALDAAGKGTWALDLAPDTGADQASFDELGVGPHGEVGALGGWAKLSDPGTVTFNGATLTSTRSTSQLSAVVDAQGAVSQESALILGTGELARTVTTDGHASVVAGWRGVNQVDGFVRSLSNDSTWTREAIGNGDQRAAVVAFTPQGLLVAISSMMHYEDPNDATLEFDGFTASSRDGTLLAWLVP